MKSLLVLSILLALGSSFAVTTSFAQEDDSKRTVNPGEDPNEARSARATESTVSATGADQDCCRARMVGSATGRGSRLSDDTTFRPRGTGNDTGSGTGKSATGTR